MTHSLDFVGLNEKLFLLRHLIAGTKEYCRREQLYQGTQREPSEDWDNYSARLRYLVSNDLIESAAKLRVIQDTVVSQLPDDYFGILEEQCQRQRKIGTVLVGEFALTIRESCNKIIHATKFDLVFQNARSVQPKHTYSYWNGICQLAGSHQRKPWRVALDVYRWADALDCFLEDIAENVVEW